MLKIKKLILLFFISAAGTVWTAAQPHMSSQAHQSAVTSILRAADGSFFSSGKDGFLIKWMSDGLGEHYQLSDLEIKMTAVNPNGTDIAIYETDGYSLHRVSVWNWKTQTRRYAKRFNTTVTALQYSARGTYLAVGTASVSGTFFFNSTQGTQIKKLRESTGIISYFTSSQTEKSSVAYSPSGYLTYYNMTNGTQKTKVSAESGLEQPFLFNNNLFFAGVKNNTVYVSDAISGKILKQVPAKKPFLLADSESADLYYLEQEGQSYTLKMLQNEGNTTVKDPVRIASITGPAKTEAAVSAIKTEGRIIIGTQTGNLYSAALDFQSDSLQAEKITDNRYQTIYDIASFRDEFYFLTKDGIYRSSYEDGTVSKAADNTEYTNIETYGDTLICWSKNTRLPVKQISLENRNFKTLFTPKSALFNLKVYDGILVYIEGNKTVNIYNMEAGIRTEMYTGTGIQDAVLYNKQQLIIAKSAASEPKAPLISVDVTTKETVLLPVSGDIAYALSYDPKVLNASVYYIGISLDGSSKKTAVYSYSPSRRNSTPILQLADEDPDAFTYLYGTTLYTNMGKMQIRSHNTQSRRETQLKRSASLPLKMTRNRTHLAVLNRDGSVSWYNQNDTDILADWYLTADGQWFEF